MTRSQPARLRSAIPECYPASDTGTAHSWFPKEWFQSSCSSGGRTAPENDGPGAGYLPGVRAREELEWEIRSTEKKDQNEISVLQPWRQDPDLLPQSDAHWFESSVCFPTAQIHAPVGCAEASV